MEMCAKIWKAEMTRCSDVLESEALALAGGSLWQWSMTIGKTGEIMVWYGEGVGVIEGFW